MISCICFADGLNIADVLTAVGKEARASKPHILDEVYNSRQRGLGDMSKGSRWRSRSWTCQTQSYVNRGAAGTSRVF